MSAATYNFNLDQGADFALELVMKEEGVVKDLTGYSARAQIRKSKEAATPAASFNCTIPAPTEGKIKLDMSNSVSVNIPAGIYYYDLEIYTGSDYFVLRLLQGQVTVTREITR
jgi:hypothetical protein